MPTPPRTVGRPSDSYPPERRCIPLSRWPKSDRWALERARAEGDAFELPGPAASWAPGTCRGRVQAYGRVLNFFERKNLLLANEGPAERLVPRRLALYLEEARQLLSPRSVDQTLQELRRILHAMVPDKDWSWITRHPGRPSRREVRASKKPPKTFDPLALCCKALDLMDHISAGPLSSERLIWYRSALIVAFQYVFTLRSRNIAKMVLGRNLIVEDGEIHLIFTVRETKNYLPIRSTIPDFLKPYLLTYLQEHRAALLAGRVSDVVWVNERHRALRYGAIAHLFKSAGECLLGHPITCHTFRHSMATTTLTKDPRKIKVAAGNLGHGSLRSVNQHYDLSGEAGSRRVWDKLRRDIVRGKRV